MIKLLLFVTGVVGMVLFSVLLGSLLDQVSRTPPASGGPVAGNGREPIGTMEIKAFDLGFEPATVDVPAAGASTP